MPIPNSLIYSFVILIFLLLSGCYEQFENSSYEEVKSSITIRQFTISDFYKINDTLTAKVDSLYNSMDINERAAQLIMPATGVSKKYGLPFAAIVKLYQSKKIGGLLFLKGTRNLFKEEISMLNNLAIKFRLIPLVYSCDCEPALFHHKFTDADSIAPSSLLKTNEEVTISANFVASEMKKIGIHWNLAPVVDINTNKEIIENRSFGSNPTEVISKSIFFINTFTQNNIATTLKHFPGHGAIFGDTHSQLLFIDSVLTEVNNFKAVINESYTTSVMMGHIAIKNNKSYSTNGLPASLSAKVVSNLLKNNLGFKGIVITDAMNMGAVRNISNADYLAINAGNDMVLMPQNVTKLHAKLLALLKTNKSKSFPIVSSIKKLLRLKICLGIIP